MMAKSSDLMKAHKNN